MLCSFNAAPLSTVLSNRFGHRLVVMAGGLLVSIGMVVASFSREVYHMYIAIGVISGKCFSRAQILQILSLKDKEGEGGTQTQSVFLSLFPFRL